MSLETVAIGWKPGFLGDRWQPLSGFRAAPFRAITPPPNQNASWGILARFRQYVNARVLLMEWERIGREIRERQEAETREQQKPAPFTGNLAPAFGFVSRIGVFGKFGRVANAYLQLARERGDKFANRAEVIQHDQLTFDDVLFVNPRHTMTKNNSNDKRETGKGTLSAKQSSLGCYLSSRKGKGNRRKI